MRVSAAKELFRTLVKRYFPGAVVIFANQSRVAKPPIPLVVITPGAVRRNQTPNYSIVNGVNVGFYHSKIPMTIDLFSPGDPIKDDDTGQVVAYANSAVDDMLSLADYINSQDSVEWSHQHDVSMVIDGDVQDLTSIVNDSNYAYRSRMVVQFYFTQAAVGYSAVLSEGSIHYPTRIDDPITGEPQYTDQEPVTTTSPTGDYVDEATEKERDAVIIPVQEQTPSGGGSVELADKEAGYFTNVVIKEETGNE